MKEILQKIKALRSIRGYSYENMAEELNISTSAYRMIEKNETKLTVERLFQIANALQTSVQQLLETNESSGFQKGGARNATSDAHPGSGTPHPESENNTHRRVQLLEDHILSLKNEIKLLHQMVSVRTLTGDLQK